VKVPDLADTEGPVTESNCVGATPPGGEQLEVNEQSVTRLDTLRQVNSIRSAVLASLRAKGRSPNTIERPAQRTRLLENRRRLEMECLEGRDNTRRFAGDFLNRSGREKNFCKEQSAGVMGVFILTDTLNRE